MTSAPVSPVDDPPPFLGTEPPPLAARGLALIIIAIFIVAAVLATVIKVPESVSSPFVLVPLRGVDLVRAPRAGRVSQVFATESARVPNGKLLFVLLSPGAADRTSELQTAEARERGAGESLANARRKSEGETLAAEAELKRLIERTTFLDRLLLLKKEQLSLSEEQAERSRVLHEQGLASQDEQADARIRRAETEAALEQLQSDRRETLTAIEKLRHTEESRRAAFREEERALLEKVREAQFRIEALRGEVAGSTPGELPITAPCSGTLLRLEVRGVGAVVQEGATLAEIACSGERLQAALTVPQTGLSRVRPGLTVRLLYEAFPYQRYGVRTGVIRWTSPAGTPVNGAPEFRAFADLAEQSIHVDGEDRQLLPGMKGTALVVVGRRSVISHAFAPLRQLQEAIR